jgi:hypothetical protein
MAKATAPRPATAGLEPATAALLLVAGPLVWDADDEPVVVEVKVRTPDAWLPAPVALDAAAVTGLTTDADGAKLRAVVELAAAVPAAELAAALVAAAAVPSGLLIKVPSSIWMLP